MTLNNRLLALTASVLILSATSVRAEDDCKKKDSTCVQREKPAECKQTYKEQDFSSVQREKPIVRDIAERRLPTVYEQETHRSEQAAKVLADMPRLFVDEANAIAVIPGVKKAAFGLGARWGRGLISVRDENGQWIPPSYVEISGGSFGFQLGIQSTDLVLIFTDRAAIDGLLRGKLTLNADASAAAGPFGRKAGAGTDILMKSGILTYSHSRGLFAGVSLDGAVLTIDDTSNRRVYGKYISGDEILVDRRVESNDAVDPFLIALNRYTPQRLPADTN